MELTPRQLDLRLLISGAMKKKKYPCHFYDLLMVFVFPKLRGQVQTLNSHSSRVGWGFRWGRGGKQVAGCHCTDGAVGRVFALSLTWMA